MSNSTLKRMVQLYRKDMHLVIPELLVVVVISLLLDVGIYIGTDMRNAVLIGPAVLLLGLAGLLPLISSFKLFSHEWSHNSIYLLMSLPASGAMVMGSKLLAVITQYLAGTLVVGLGAALSVYHIIPPQAKVIPEFQMVLNNPDTYLYLALFYLFTIIVMFFLFSASFFSQSVGRLRPKFSKLSTLAAFVAVIWLMQWGLDLIGINAWNWTVNERDMAAVWHNTILPALTSYSISYLVAGIILFVGAVIIYDRRLGV
jgi:hypothetical protein